MALNRAKGQQKRGDPPATAWSGRGSAGPVVGGRKRSAWTRSGLGEDAIALVGHVDGATCQPG